MCRGDYDIFYCVFEDEYLHLGSTCWTVVLLDCVHWPPGPSHMGLDSKQLLQVILPISCHKLSWRAVNAYKYRGIKRH